MLSFSSFHFFPPINIDKEYQINSSEFWLLSLFCASMIKWPESHQKKYSQSTDPLYVIKLIIKAYSCQILLTEVENVLYEMRRVGRTSKLQESHLPSHKGLSSHYPGQLFLSRETHCLFSYCAILSQKFFGRKHASVRRHNQQQSNGQ